MQIQSHQVVAHRGYQRHYPENTVLSIQKAIEAGALHVELDVQLSRDHIPMIYHDDTLERVSGFHGRVCEYDAEELIKVSAFEPARFEQRFRQEKISRLAALVEVANQFPQVTFYVELKEEAVRDQGVDICLKNIQLALQPILTQVVLISFDQQALARAKAAGFDRIGLVTRDWEAREKAIKTLQASILFINKKRIPVTEAITASCPVVLYEVDALEEAIDWLQRGADKVESYAVGELLTVSSGQSLI